MAEYKLDAPLLEYLPDWYLGISDYREIIGAEQAQMELLADALSTVANNFFFQAMDADTVSRWEQILHIVPNPSVETLEFRRDRVLNRVSTRPPFTLGFLYRKLDELIGPNQWTLTVDYAHYTIYIESDAESQQYASEVEYTLNTIKPAHIVYRNTPRVQSGLLLSESVELARRTFYYRLGSWALGALPFAVEEPQGEIKMPTTPSIQTTLLDGTASFVSKQVAKARINGSILIEDIDKNLSGSVLTVTYGLTPAQTDEVTRVELLDAAGNQLTASTVYVPVTNPIIMKHRIPVKEGVVKNG